MKIIIDHPDSASSVARELYSVSIKYNSEWGISTAFMGFGYIAALLGKGDSAKMYYKKALNIRKKNRFEEETISTYSQLTTLYSDLGLKDSAFYFLFEALRWNKTSAKKDYSGIIYTYLGGLYMDYNDPAKAIPYLRKGIAITQTQQDTHIMIMAYAPIGIFYYQKNQYDSALYYFKQCEQLSLQSGQENALADASNNMALCYAETGKTRLAIDYYRRALSVYTRKNIKSDIALTYLNMGALFLDTRQTDSAIYYLNAARELSRETGDLNILLKCLEYLADAYAEKGDYFSAYDYHIRFSMLNDSLLDDEKISQIAEMQTKYDTEKKEHQISLLDEKSRTRSAQRNFFIAGSAVLLVLLLGLSYFFVQRQKLAMKNEEIARQKISTLLNEQEIKSYNAMIEGQEEERKRLAGDLHDRLGSMLSTVKLLFGALGNKMGRLQDENKKQFESINTLLDETVAEVRKVSHDLSTGMVMSFGLVPALQELCTGIDDSGLIKCKLLAYGMGERLETQTEIGLYRMVQEMVSNILKHAKAKNIIIQLNRSEDTLTVTVEDDGTGFDVAAKKQSGGLGLKNLEARAAKIGGGFHVDSRPGKGTISIIEVGV